MRVCLITGKILQLLRSHWVKIYLYEICIPGILRNPYVVIALLLCASQHQLTKLGGATSDQYLPCWPSKDVPYNRKVTFICLRSIEGFLTIFGRAHESTCHFMHMHCEGQESCLRKLVLIQSLAGQSVLVMLLYYQLSSTVALLQCEKSLRRREVLAF